MQHQRSLSRDEWLPARRRRLSRETELTRQRDRSNGERRGNETGTDLDPTDSGRPHDAYEDEARHAAA